MVPGLNDSLKKHGSSSDTTRRERKDCAYSVSGHLLCNSNNSILDSTVASLIQVIFLTDFFKQTQSPGAVITLATLILIQCFSLLHL